MTETVRVFVYGTLKRNEPNYHIISDETRGKHKFIDTATTIDKYPLFVATADNIPFIVNDRGQGFQIRGELYDVDKQKLESLDECEGYPGWYNRIIIDVVDSKGEKHSAYIYLLDEYDSEMEKTRTKFIDNYTDGVEGRIYREE
uniref:Gamma-glutamylcyclotransferase family protein n=1 Tax=Panagrellus redivivus TaxID=6233 RepID=A0A7E5A1G8_PANRE